MDGLWWTMRTTRSNLKFQGQRQSRVHIILHLHAKLWISHMYQLQCLLIIINNLSINYNCMCHLSHDQSMSCMRHLYWHKGAHCSSIRSSIMILAAQDHAHSLSVVQAVSRCKLWHQVRRCVAWSQIPSERQWCIEGQWWSSTQSTPMSW